MPENKLEPLLETKIEEFKPQVGAVAEVAWDLGRQGGNNIRHRNHSFHVNPDPGSIPSLRA